MAQVTGFTLPCPRCGATEACIALRLASLAEDDACSCDECSEIFSLEDVRLIIDRWTRVLAWIDTAPSFDDAT